MISQVVAQRVLGRIRPLQPFHPVTPGFQVECLVRRGAIVKMNLQSRQVAHFSGHGSSVGQGSADFAQAFASAAVAVAFDIVVFILTLYRRNAGQLVAPIPGHGLATLQKAQVAITVEAAVEIRRLILFFKQTAIAVRGHSPAPGEGLRAEVPQFGHVAGRVVVVFFAVVHHGVGVARGAVTGHRVRGGLLGFPAGGADQLAEAVIDEGAPCLDQLVLMETDRQRAVVDLKDVADRVDFITQVLQG
ncbi:hypothetical protein D3C81_1092290 [compost metagenome]